MTNAVNGKTLKSGVSTTLRFDIPESWDVVNMSEIAVSVTDSSGTALDSGTATLWTADVLDSASSAHDTAITLSTGTDDLFPGDTILIGADGENREIRTVFSYDTATHEVTLTEELDFAHADGADVIAMFATYDLDLSDTAVFPNGIELRARWIPDTSDPEYAEPFVVGVDSFAESGFWKRFQVLCPTEYGRIKAEDRDIFIEEAKSAMRREMLSAKNMDIDRIQHMDMMQEGLRLRLRLLALSPTGDPDDLEYERAKGEWGDWINSVSKLPMWEDGNQNKIAEPKEIKTNFMFCETARYS